MLLEVIKSIESGNLMIRKQNDLLGSYYPLRFPEDGLILWDIHTSIEIHNRIRALTEPYPCAFTFFNGRKVKLLSSMLLDQNYFGEPGRVYRKSAVQGLLICAADKCLWVKESVFEDNPEPLFDTIQRYDKLATIRDSFLKNIQE